MLWILRDALREKAGKFGALYVMEGRLQSLLYNLPPCNSQALYNYSLNLNFRVLVVGIDKIDEGGVVYADGHFLGCYVFEIFQGLAGFLILKLVK